jgi:hypothetical protein
MLVILTWQIRSVNGATNYLGGGFTGAYMRAHTDKNVTAKSIYYALDSKEPNPQKNEKETLNSGSFYSARGVLLPVLTSGGE